MSKQADSSSLSVSPPSLSASSSTVVPPSSAAKSSNAPDSDPSLLRPCYYLERPDGTRTALVELDLLPEHIRIKGLPHKLSTADTTGMMSVGIREGGQRKYTVEIAESSANFHLGEPTKPPAIKHTGPENTSIALAATPSSRAPSDTMTVVNKEAVAFGTPSRTDQETVISKPILRKGEKVYCTYWLARGECHFAQQGCKFKHEMPNLETLEIIMGRRTFPKWWLESIGLVSALPQHFRHTATNDRQQGKRRAITQKPFALPAPTNTHTNSTSGPAPPSMVVQAIPEGFSNMVKSSPNTAGNRFATRQGGGVDIRRQVSVASGSSSNMHSPVAGPSGSNARTPFSLPNGGNIRSSISSPSAGNTRFSISGPSGSNVRASMSGPSGSNIRASISGPISSNSITQSKPPVHDIRSTDPGSNSNIRPLIPGLSDNSVFHGKQLLSNNRSPDNSSISGSNMIQANQPVGNDRSPISGTISNTTIQTTKQPDDSLSTSTSPADQTAEQHPLRIKIPRKYKPPFRVAVLPTLSSIPSTSSATAISRPRVNLPPSRHQEIDSSVLGNTNGDKNIVSSTLGGNAGNANAYGGKKEIMEGRSNEGGIFGGGRSNRGNETTRPYDEVFDLLGPF